MNNKLFLSEIYNDFFGNIENSNSEKFLEQDKDIPEENNFLEEIDNLYLDDSSKELLQKMILFMKAYHKKTEKNYIPFSIIIETDNKEIVEKVTNILKIASSEYGYSKSNVSILSFYKFDKVEELEKYYQNGIVVIKDLNAFDIYDDTFKKKFIHLLKEKLSGENITIITGKREEIELFFQNDELLKSQYFLFSLKGKILSVQDIYIDVMNRLDDSILTETFKVNLLDYITSTYPNIEIDYSTYMKNLIQYISFHKELPLLKIQKSVEDIFQELNELVGLEKVKKALYELVDLITLKKKTEKDLKLGNINLHMVFLGNPGTGKTTVARMICEILFDLNYIKQNKLIEVSSKDLVGEYVGQTAPKTMNVIERVKGGVLFIDEAYALGDNGKNSYNAEAIATLIKAMEDYRDELVVIFAGYTKEMQSFLTSNSGLLSRIGYTLEFDDYTNNELKQIFINMMDKSGFILEENVFEVLDKLITENRNSKNFGNARFIRNVYEKTILKHATNTKNKKRKTILKTITKDDICI